jgi:CBS domain-containing protein
MSDQDRPLPRVQDAMTHDPLVVHCEDDAEPLIDLFERHDFSAIPVVDPGGDLLGMVTKLSLLRLYRMGKAVGGADTTGLSRLRVRDVMDARKVWVETSDGLDAVVRHMTRYHVRSVPVVARSGGHRRLVGVVTYRDLRRAISGLPPSA